jgi:hypothetical protein
MKSKRILSNVSRLMMTDLLYACRDTLVGG